jgi:hypothetical protein
VVCGIDMFDRIASQLESHTSSKSDKYFFITNQEFDDFCKGFLFEELKGTKLGTEFCEKFGQTNYVISILHNKAAKEHIRRFYIK